MSEDEPIYDCVLHGKDEDVDDLKRQVDRFIEYAQNKIQLISCPFCGRNDVDIAKGIEKCNNKEFSVFFGVCYDCGGRTDFFKTEKEAAEAWNKRNTVYCKDCRFRKDNWLCSLLVDKPDTFIVTPDFYCAYGEKKK